MSFDIFMAPFQNGASSSFNQSLLLEVFGRNAGLEDSAFSRIRYSNDDGAELYGADEKTIADGLSFNHCGGDRFFQGLWRLADRTNAIIFWLGAEGNAVATSKEALAHADLEFIEPLQPVRIVASGEELLNYMSEQLS